MLDKTWWRDNGALLLFGLVGLTSSVLLLSQVTGQPLLPRISLSELLAPYVPGALAIAKTLALAILITGGVILLWLLVVPFRDWLIYQLEQRNEADEQPITIYATHNELTEERQFPIKDYRTSERPAAQHDNGMQAELANAIAERNEWEHKYRELSKHQIEKELTYSAVLALMSTGGKTSINEAQAIVRANGGVVGRDYKPLQAILKGLAALSPTDEQTPIHSDKQAVNRKYERVNGRVNTATGRSQPRKRRG